MFEYLSRIFNNESSVSVLLESFKSRKNHIERKKKNTFLFFRNQIDNTYQ